MKRIISLALTAIMLVVCAMPTLAANVGDVQAYTTYTDIVAYINHYLIESYNIDGYTVIVAEDLANYGFDVVWNGADRTLSISRNLSKNKVTQPTIPFETPASKVGKQALPVLVTDIKTYLGGVEVQSYNIGGRTVISFDSLAKFGAVKWDGTMRTLKLWVEDGLEMCSVMQQPQKLPLVTLYAPDGRTTQVEQAEVEAYKKVGWYENRYAAVASQLPAHNLKIFEVEVEINSVGGVEPIIRWRNDSGKTIKYIYFTVVPYNAVGDIVSCRISGDSTEYLQVTGPYEPYNKAKASFIFQKGKRQFVYNGPDGTPQFYDSNGGGFVKLTPSDLDYGFDSSASWDPIWYNYSVERVVITEAEVIYMDGTSEKFYNPPVWGDAFIKAGL